MSIKAHSKFQTNSNLESGVCHIVSYTHHTWAFEALGLNTLTFRLPVSVSVKIIYAPYAALKRLGTLKFGNGGVSNNFIYAPYAGLKALRLNTLTLGLPVSVSVKNIYAPYAALERQGTLEFGKGGVSINFIYAAYAGLKPLRLNTLTLGLPVS